MFTSSISVWSSYHFSVWAAEPRSHDDKGKKWGYMKCCCSSQQWHSFYPSYAAIWSQPSYQRNLELQSSWVSRKITWHENRVDISATVLPNGISALAEWAPGVSDVSVCSCRCLDEESMWLGMKPWQKKTKQRQSVQFHYVSLLLSGLINNAYQVFINSIFPLTLENFQLSLKSLGGTLKFTMQAFCFKESILSSIAIFLVFYWGQHNG